MHVYVCDGDRYRRWSLGVHTPHFDTPISSNMCPYVYVEFQHGQIQEVKLGAPGPLFSMLNLAVACHNELYVRKWLS